MHLPVGTILEHDSGVMHSVIDRQGGWITLKRLSDGKTKEIKRLAIIDRIQAEELEQL